MLPSTTCKDVLLTSSLSERCAPSSEVEKIRAFVRLLEFVGVKCVALLMVVTAVPAVGLLVGLLMGVNMFVCKATSWLLMSCMSTGKLLWGFCSVKPGEMAVRLGRLKYFRTAPPASSIKKNKRLLEFVWSSTRLLLRIRPEKRSSSFTPLSASKSITSMASMSLRSLLKAM